MFVVFNRRATGYLLICEYGFILRHAGSSINELLPKKEVETAEILVMVQMSI